MEELFVRPQAWNVYQCFFDQFWSVVNVYGLFGWVSWLMSHVVTNIAQTQHLYTCDPTMLQHILVQDQHIYEEAEAFIHCVFIPTRYLNGSKPCYLQWEPTSFYSELGWCLLSVWNLHANPTCFTLTIQSHDAGEQHRRETSKSCVFLAPYCRNDSSILSGHKQGWSTNMFTSFWI